MIALNNPSGVTAVFNALAPILFAPCVTLTAPSVVLLLILLLLQAGTMLLLR
jgi:ABC-type Co2+ transport system permease subunit